MNHIYQRYLKLSTGLVAEARESWQQAKGEAREVLFQRYKELYEQMEEFDYILTQAKFERQNPCVWKEVYKGGSLGGNVRCGSCTGLDLACENFYGRQSSGKNVSGLVAQDKTADTFHSRQKYASRNLGAIANQSHNVVRSEVVGNDETVNRLNQQTADTFHSEGEHPPMDFQFTRPVYRLPQRTIDLAQYLRHSTDGVWYE